MAQYRVDHICGHRETHRLFGPGRERERKLEWLATTECSDCYKERIAREREAAAATAHNQAEASGLPALEGSPKQIAWAETIRAKMMLDVERIVPRALAQLQDSDQTRKDAAQFALDICETLKRETQAHWYIEHRTDRVDDIIHAEYKRVHNAVTVGGN